MKNHQPAKYRELIDRAGLQAAQGQWQAVEETCRQAVACSPDRADAWYLLGLAYHNTGQIEAALTAYETVVSKSSCHADALNNLGSVHESAGAPEKALECFKRAVACNPSHAIACYNLGRLLRTSGKPADAIACLERASASSPGSIQILLELGLVHKLLGRYQDAAQAVLQVLELNRENPAAHNLLGNIFQMQGRLDEAENCYRAAINLQPEFAEAYNNLGSACLAGGNVPLALEHYRQALVLKPGWHGAVSNVLLAENYVCDDPQYLHALHRDLCSNYPGPTGDRAFLDAGNRGKIRIGYVSPDFRVHSVAWFLNAHLAGFDQSGFEIIAFSDTPAADDMTGKMKALVTEWYSIAGMSDADVYTLISERNIDILVDLAGHTANNRLAVFSMQPAPAQASYLGYPNTTGISAIRYRISDAWADPPGESDHHHTETILRLPGGFLCYTPPDGCPEVAKPPVHTGRNITYGSFNVLAKISDPCLLAWCAVLEQDPGARLLLKSAGLQDQATRENLIDRFVAQGIDAARVELLPRTMDFSSHMLQYNRVDISLDTFPYNGTTTSCESLWMGVPVITLAGNRHAGRVGCSLLEQLDLGSLVARDVHAYVSIAQELARDTDQLGELRASLRGRMAASRLCDTERFSRELEAAYQFMPG